jgi:carbon-monoxide dehydrogenase medium subunit
VKPSPFTYHRPEQLNDALSTLAELGGAAKVLAGGQSLLPILSMRIAAPEHLVDINRLAKLDYVRSDQTGVRVGALARQASVERDDAAAKAQPLLRQALRHVAHPTIRNRGTTVGSLAHADPSGELTAVLALTGGSVTLASGNAVLSGGNAALTSGNVNPASGNAVLSGGNAVLSAANAVLANGSTILDDGTGRRVVPASEFFVGVLESAVGPGELAIEAFFPAFAPGTGTAFVEIARRNGDYALCGVAAAVQREADGTVLTARTAYISMGPVPVVISIASGEGEPEAAASWRAVAKQAIEQLEPETDLHASADYRRQLAGVLTARALAAAAKEAQWQVQ